VRASRKSKYGYVPSMNIIGDLLKTPRRFAMACTPCQLAAWHLACDFLPKLKDCLRLSLGLICGQVQTYDSVPGLASTLGIDYPEDAEFISWRCGEYPGSSHFRLRDGTILKKHLYRSLDIVCPHYSLNRCYMCQDSAAWLADISVSDFHPGQRDETALVCRTRRGEEVIESAINAAAIAVTPMSRDQVERSTSHSILISSIMPAAAINEWKAKADKPHALFDHGIEIRQRTHSEKLGPFPMTHLWIFRYKLISWLTTKWRKRFLRTYPRLLEPVGHFAFNFPRTLPVLTVSARAWNKFKRIVQRTQTH